MRALVLIFLIVVLPYGCGKTIKAGQEIITDAHHINGTKVYKAGDHIKLEFSKKLNASAFVLVKYGWGTTVISVDTVNFSKFVLPQYVSKKSGIFDWLLVSNNKVVDSGKIKIVPSESLAKNMETYLGPTSILANGSDKSMYVSLPQDMYGNPLGTGTKIVSETQFKNRKVKEEIEVEYGIAYKYLEGADTVGNLYVSSYLNNQISKEFNVEILPTRAIDFFINAKQEHIYADGNQVFNIQTSKIIDANGHKVADGTLVEFIALNSYGQMLVAYGQTLNGYAIGKFLHPEEPTKWQIHASINGIAKSNTIAVEFKAAFEDFPVEFNHTKDSIQIGPIKSYMKQLIPDGLPVKIKVLEKNGTEVFSAVSHTDNGIVKTEIPSHFRKEKFTIQINAGGISKIVKPY